MLPLYDFVQQGFTHRTDANTYRLSIYSGGFLLDRRWLQYPRIVDWMNSDGGGWWYRQGIPGWLGGDDEFEINCFNSASQWPLTKLCLPEPLCTAATSYYGVAKLQQPCQN